MLIMFYSISEHQHRSVRTALQLVVKIFINDKTYESMASSISNVVLGRQSQ